VASVAIGNYAQVERGFRVVYSDWRRGNTRPVRDYDNVGMQLWIYNYCRQHPLDVVATAALALYKELGGQPVEH
jgi:hypothetical protein